MSELPKPSMGNLRQHLFEVLANLKSGTITAQDACAAAKVAQTLLNTVSVQIEFERMKLDSEVPARLPDMDIVSIGPAKPEPGSPEMARLNRARG